MLKIVLAAVLLVLGIASASAHGLDAGGVQIIHPWATPGASSSRVHPTIANDGAARIVIVSAESPVAARVILILDGAPVRELAIPAGEVLTPDMLAFQLDRLVSPLSENQHFPLTIILSDGRRITFHVVVGETATMPEIE